MESRNNGQKKTTYGGRPRMSLEDRAKIFSPFDPLTGFRDALRDKEREIEEEISRGISPAHAMRKRRG